MSQTQTTATTARNINQVVAHLSRVFNASLNKLPKAVYTKEHGSNFTYRKQSEFAYILNEIIMQPPAAQQIFITQANEFIGKTMLEAQAEVAKLENNTQANAPKPTKGKRTAKK